MNDADRIRALRDEGRIDDAQAQRLLQALDAIAAEEAAEPAGSTDAPVDHATSAHATAATTHGATADEMPGAASTTHAATPAGPAEPGPAETRPLASETGGEVDRWARIEVFACAVEAEVDPSLDAPVVDAGEGEIEVHRDGDDWRIAQAGGREGTWLERLVDGVRRSKMRLRLPLRTGVELDIKAGDVELDGVPALRGRLMAGDLDARGLRAVDIAVNAGDVDLGLDPAPGLHRIRLSVGDVDVHLPEHADVRIEGHVSIGDASAPRPFVTERSGMVAERIAGVMGEGRATLKIDVGTGDVSIGARHGR